METETLESPFITYRVDAITVALFYGRLRLTEKQAKIREHALTPLGGDVYEITAAVHFKRGEVFDYDGAVSKSMVSQLVVQPVAVSPDVTVDGAVNDDDLEEAGLEEAALPKEPTPAPTPAPSPTPSPTPSHQKKKK